MVSIIQNCSYADAITHAGVFHADEVFATVILSRIIQDLKVCRVRRAPVTPNSQAVIYDIGEGQYDHHQQGVMGYETTGPLRCCGAHMAEIRVFDL